MKHQLDQSQLKKWLTIGGISWFFFSMVFPLRYLWSLEQVTILFSILAMPLLYAVFQVLYILKNRQLQTYADILNFLDPKRQVKTSISSEIWFVFWIFLYSMKIKSRLGDEAMAVLE